MTREEINKELSKCIGRIEELNSFLEDCNRNLDCENSLEIAERLVKESIERTKEDFVDIVMSHFSNSKKCCEDKPQDTIHWHKVSKELPSTSGTYAISYGDNPALEPQYTGLFDLASGDFIRCGNVKYWAKL